MRKLLIFSALFLFGQFVFAQAWMQRTNFPGDGRHRASGFSIGNRGYLGIGHVNGNNATINYKDFWEYDPSSDSWTQKADYPTVNYGAIAFATSTRGYIGGGAFLGPEFYEFNPQTNTWTAIPNCPVSPGDQGCFAVNDKGYVIWGSALYEYNPTTTTWTAKATAPIAFTNWCVGFSHGASGYIKNGNSLYEYKPLYDQWVVRAAFPGVNTNGGGALVRGGRAFIISGYVGALANVTSEVWEYNPGNNTWIRMNDFPGTSRRFSVAFTINDRGYFGTGTNGINLNDFWELNDNVGVGEFGEQRVMVHAYPNPATEYIRFSLEVSSNNSQHAVRLYDVLGNLVDEIEFTGNVIDVPRNGKAAGQYLFQIVEERDVVATGNVIFN